MTDSIIFSLSTLVLGGQILSAIFLVSLVLYKLNPKGKTIFHKIINFVSINAIAITFVLSSIATGGSLFLSEVANFLPCRLCWYQRIFMYPLATITFVGLLTNEKTLAKYVLSVASVGFLIALYHVLLQAFPNVLECSEEVAKCSAVQFADYGYITIPVMSLTAFLMIILVNITPFIVRKK